MSRTTRSRAALLLSTIALSTFALLSTTGAAATAHSPVAESRGAKAHDVTRLPDGLVIPKDGRLRTAHQDEALFNAITTAFAEGATDAELREDFGLVKVSGGASLNAAANASATAPARGRSPHKGQRACGGVDYAGTSASDITVGRPGFYAAQWPATGYVVRADWRWTRQPLGLSPHATGCYQTIGGLDGIGLVLNRDVARTQQGVVACTSSNQCHGVGNISDNNARGASFTFQDASTALTSNSHHGTIAVGFNYLRPGACHQAFAKYFHTWRRTSVTGVTIAPWSISASWSSQDAQWEKAGNAGRNGQC